MFDFAWSEFALIGIVGLLFIGPKDMPVAIRTVTNLLKKGRKMAGEFQTHVDEMVRDADLGEARDQFRQLRSFNVRGQIMKALDEDGSLKRVLEEKPFAPAGPRFATPSQSLPTGGSGTDLPAAQHVGDRMVHGLPATGGDRSWRGAAASMGTGETEIDIEALAAADPAPSIVPPRVANRLRVERARPLPPSFVPPQPLHANPAIRPPKLSRPDYRPGAGLN